jgi:hypothetical protein
MPHGKGPGKNLTRKAQLKHKTVVNDGERLKIKRVAILFRNDCVKQNIVSTLFGVAVYTQTLC